MSESLDLIDILARQTGLGNQPDYTNSPAWIRFQKDHAEAAEHMRGLAQWWGFCAATHALPPSNSDFYEQYADGFNFFYRQIRQAAGLPEPVVSPERLAEWDDMMLSNRRAQNRYEPLPHPAPGRSPYLAEMYAVQDMLADPGRSDEEKTRITALIFAPIQIEQQELAQTVHGRETRQF